MPDPHDLQRFVVAQESGGTYDAAVDELRRGRKTTHWMWFVFPQIAGLGRSATAQRYAVTSLGEATAYLGHPILGPRLFECTQILADADHGSAAQVLGSIDAQKLRSSMTLFLRAAPDEPLFERVLDRYFEARPDPETDRLLSALSGS